MASSTVLIPTYRRASLLKYTLEGLTEQSYGNFEVLIILKPSGDGSESIIDEFKRKLSINCITQTKGYFINAVSRGLRKSRGDITLFLDDDAIPNNDLIEKHVQLYDNNENIGGVSGNVIPKIIKDGKVSDHESPSEILLSIKPPKKTS